MAEALLITRNDLVRLTALNGNVDTDKFIQFIKIAQDVQIENDLGTKLVDKLEQLIEDNEVNDRSKLHTVRPCYRKLELSESLLHRHRLQRVHQCCDHQDLYLLEVEPCHQRSHLQTRYVRILKFRHGHA